MVLIQVLLFIGLLWAASVVGMLIAVGLFRILPMRDIPYPTWTQEFDEW